MLISQFKAVFLKNLALQRHQWATTICQMLTPVILVALIGVLQLIVNNQVAQMEELQPPADFAPLKIWETPSQLSFNPGKNRLFQGVPYFRVAIDGQGRSAEEIGRIQRQLGNLSYTNYRSGMLGNIPNQMQKLPFGITKYFPHIIKYKMGEKYNSSDLYTPDELNSDIIDSYEFWRELLDDRMGFGPKDPWKIDPHWKEVLADKLFNDDYDLIPPMGALVINQLQLDNQFKLDVTLRPGGRYGGWMPSSLLNISKLQIFYPEIDRIGNLMSIATNSFASSVFGKRYPLIRTQYRGLPQREVSALDLSSILGVFLLGFALSFLLPSFISQIVIDRHDKILLMMEMSGLKLCIYWLVTIIYNMFTYIVVITALWITGLLFQMRFFTQTDPWFLILLFFVWGLSLNTQAFFFASLFRTPRTASIIAYLIVIFGVIVSNLLNSSVFLMDVPPVWYLLYPPFSFFRILFVLGDACIRLQCMSTGDVFADEKMVLVMSMLVVMSAVMGFIGWIRRRSLDAAPQSFSQQVKSFFNRIEGMLGKKVQAATLSYEEIACETSTDSLATIGKNSMSTPEHSNLDTITQKLSIRCEAIPDEDAAVVIKGISKVYPNNVVAVKEMYLTLKRGEVFGLLGANGAGKTTLISCLTGLQKVTSGTALFANNTLDLIKDLPQIQSRLGVCMQFDVFYPKLSASEHLLFYARLKGLEGDNLKNHVEDLIKSVGLFDVKDREARHLSGGMRRRLSMAIAATGSPDLIIYDEPSVGLDPKTRREVWTVFQEMRERRAKSGNPVTVILTTHGMEEADELCDRIGIMCKGELKCIGTAESLKQKYDIGYLLSIQVAYDDDLQEKNPEKMFLSQFVMNCLDRSLEAKASESSIIQLPCGNFTTESGIKVEFKPDLSLGRVFTYQIRLPPTASSSVGFLNRFFQQMSACKSNSVRVIVPENKWVEDLDSTVDTQPTRTAIIKEWGLNRTTLEDVFLQVVK